MKHNTYVTSVTALAVLLLACLVSSCSSEMSDLPPTMDIGELVDKPDNLKDCSFNKVWYLNPKTSDPSVRYKDYTLVVRCPNSSTTTSYKEQVGKASYTRTVTVVDGKDFELLNPDSVIKSVDGKNVIETPVGDRKVTVIDGKTYIESKSQSAELAN